jgi:hypothetical protein
MTDPKQNPNKQRRSFFWRRKPLQMREPEKTPSGLEAGRCEARPWYRLTCVFGKPALSRILGLFPGGFAATTSG